jgi:hypothetical protein
MSCDDESNQKVNPNEIGGMEQNGGIYGGEDTGGTLVGGSTTSVQFDLPNFDQINAAPPVPSNRFYTLSCFVDQDCRLSQHCFNQQCVSLCDNTRACSDEQAECTNRGRCLSTSVTKEDVSISKEEEIRPSIIKAPTYYQEFASDADQIALSISLSGNPTPSTLKYTVKDSLGMNDGTILKEVFITEEGKADLIIDLNSSLIEENENDEIPVTINTEYGSLEFILSQKVAPEGSYNLSAILNTYGSSELPFRASILTIPPNTTLEEADEIYFILPIGPNELFTLTAGETEIRYVASLVQFDPLVGQWVARFENQFQFATTSFLARPTSDPIRRSIRFAFDFTPEGKLFGTVADRWSGLYDNQTVSGVSNREVLSFQGTISGQRFGDPPSLSEVQISSSFNEEIQPRGLPPLNECEGIDDLFINQDLNFTSFDSFTCGDLISESGYRSLDQFQQDEEGAPFSNRAQCALAITHSALAEQSTGSILIEYISGGTPGGKSFAEFLAECVDETNDTCKPSQKVLCGRQMLAYTVAASEDEIPEITEVMEAFQKASQEAFLGQQLASFQIDLDTRLAWLTATNFPAEIASVMRDFIGDLLDEWVSKVVDVRLHVVRNQYDASSLALLSRQVVSESALAIKKIIMFELSQSWRLAIDSLNLAATRWNELLLADVDREQKTKEISTRLLDFYVIGGIARSLNLRSNAGFANASLSGGFGLLLKSLE